jgi:putative transposase
VKFAFISEEKVAFPVAALGRFSERLLRCTRAPAVAARWSRRQARGTGGEGPHGEQVSVRQPPCTRRAQGRRREGGSQARGQADAREEAGSAHAPPARATTDSKHDFPIAPNVLDRDFTASAPDRAWVTDITFLWTAQGWLYLAAILDLFSRRVVGWATSQNVDRHLALAALDTALARRRPAAGLVHHSDRGSTYASSDYRKALNARGLECSMSRKGDCWDNAVAESFFSTLKRELEGIDDFESRAGATLSIGDYIDGFYNVQRRHSAINYTSPIEFELIHSVKRAAA